MASCHRGAGLLAEKLCLSGRLLMGKEGPPLESWVSSEHPALLSMGSGCRAAGPGDGASELDAGSLGSLTGLF